MNELMKVSYDSDRPTVLGRALDEIENFVDFYIAVSKLKVEFSRDNLIELRDYIDKFISLFGKTAITYLKDDITAEMCLQCKREPEDIKTEKEYQAELISDFSKIFPWCTLIGSEISVIGVGRIDILATDNATGNPVIMELKIKNKNPNAQLLAYSSHYKNPILIGITETDIDVKQKLENIKYYTFKELLTSGLKEL